MATSSVKEGGVLFALGSSVQISVGGLGACAIQLSGTWVGTVIFEVSLTKDTWSALNCFPPNSTTAVTGSSANGLWTGTVSGMQAVRVRCTAFTSGLIDVSLQAVAAGGAGGGSTGGGSTPGGSDTQLQFNDGGAFGGNAGLTFNKTTGALTMTPVVISVDSSGSQERLVIRPNGAGNGYFELHTGPGANQYGQVFEIWADSNAGTHPSQGANYYNSLVRYGSTPDGLTSVNAYEIGSEGNIPAGTYTQQRFYLWQFDTTGANGRSVFYIDLTEPNKFHFGDTAAHIDVESVSGRLMSGGLPISTDANLTVSAAQLLTTFTKNDGNTREFEIALIQPTFNFGGSNTTTTVNVLTIDTTNTSLTGLAIGDTHLWNVSYGGTLVSRLSGNGLFEVQAPAGAGGIQFTQFNNGAAGALLAMRKGRGTVAAPLRTKSLDTIGGLSAFGYTAVDDTTGAVVSTAVGAARFIAAEAYTTTTLGSQFQLLTVAIGATTNTARLFVDSIAVHIGQTTAARSTTQPTNALNIYDGTAPVGTLTNGISLYSTSGELRVMDAAGNATLLSPHDDDGRWIHDEINYKGRRLRVDMERLVKALDVLLGGGFVEEQAA